MYSCKKCGLAVIIENSQVFKPCKCGAPIVADMKVSLKGTGGVSNDNK